MSLRIVGQIAGTIVNLDSFHPHGAGFPHYRRNSPGSFAKFTASRPAASRASGSTAARGWLSFLFLTDHLQADLFGIITIHDDRSGQVALLTLANFLGFPFRIAACR